jgi:ABC-type antimicrobial peptide transport system permease subunit
MKNKKIIFYVTRQYMKQNKKRTWMTAIGIFLMVVLITCVFIGKDTALSYLTQVAESKSGSWHVIAYNADSEQYEKIKNLSYIDETAVSYDMGFSECEQSKNSQKPYWELKAYSDSCFDWMNIHLTEGRFPAKSGEAVISKTAIDDGAGLKVGDKIEVSTFKRSITITNPDTKSMIFPFYNMTIKYGETVEVPQDFPFYDDNDSFQEIHTPTGVKENYTIVGVIDSPSYETQDSSFYSLLAYTPNVMGDRETVNVSCRMNLKKKYDVSDIQEIMGTDDGSYEFNDLVLTFAARSSDSSLNIIVNFIVIFFLIFILVVSMILIYNGFNISFEERSRYLGMLSSIGATKHQKNSSVYYEIFTLLMAALPSGILAGLGVVKAGMMVLQPYILKLEDSIVAASVNNDMVHLKITPLNIFMVIVFSFVTVLISSMLPARKIRKSGSIESIRGTRNIRKKGYKSPKYLWRMGNAQVLLAYNHLHRQSYKSKSMVRAIAVFMIVLIVAVFGTNAVTQMVYYRLVDDVSVRENLDGYDYVLTENSGNAEMYLALKKEIMESSDIADTKEWYEGMFAAQFDGRLLNQEYWDTYQRIAQEYYHGKLSDEEFENIVSNGDGYRNSQMNIMAVDKEAFQQIAENCGVDEKISDSAKYPGILYQNIELSTDNLSFEGEQPDHYRMYEMEKICDMEPGSDFPLSMYNAQSDELEDFHITLTGYADRQDIADYVTFHGEHIWMIVSTDTAQQMNQVMSAKDSLDEDGNYNVMPRQLFIKLSDKQGELAKRLQELSTQTQETYFVYSAGNGKSLTSIAETINYIIKVLAVSFVLFTALICLLNLYNSIQGRAVVRRKEMAMLRSVGMQEGQMHKMLFYENLGMWIRGFVWSVFISVPVTYGIGRMLKQYFGEIKLHFPWEMYGFSLLITMLSLAIMTGICYHKNDSSNIMELMRKEE